MDPKLKAAIEILSLGVQLVGLTAGTELHLEHAVMLARAIEGEGAGLFANRDEVGAWIAHTAINRTTKRWWTNDITMTVRESFHGYTNVEVPSAWSLFVVNEADVQKLGADKLARRRWSRRSARMATRCTF
jgi:hypothetical protein